VASTRASARATHLGLTAALLAVAAVAWVAVAVRMGGMESGPGMVPEELGVYLSTWIVMMAAMMLPSVWPAVGLYATLHQGRRGEGRAAPGGATGMFVGGYLVVWAAAGVVAFASYRAARAIAPDTLMWEEGGHWVAAAVIGLAAVYELTPLKDACLRRCRSPLGFFVTGWRDGRGGALRMGATHGGWCLGCCWALMGALFALGLMSLVWTVVIAALVAVEKLLPWRVVATATVTAALAGLAVAVAAAPAAFMG
jgi:predicted metal-binding membrane protein